MSNLASILLANSLLMIPLACIAWLVGRNRNMSVLAHALWILCLLKLIVPPLLPINLSALRSHLPTSNEVQRQPTGHADASTRETRNVPRPTPHPATVVPSTLTNSTKHAVDDRKIDVTSQPERLVQRESQSVVAERPQHTNSSASKASAPIAKPPQKENALLPAPSRNRQTSTIAESTEKPLPPLTMGSSNRPLLESEKTLLANRRSAPANELAFNPSDAIRSWSVWFTRDRLTLFLAWFAGLSLASTGIIWMIASQRLIRFERALHAALVSAESPAAIRLADQLAVSARQIGLARVPALWVVQEEVIAFVWPWRKIRIVVAESLAHESDGFIQAVLLHECAHIRRRDYWVRWLELVVTSFYWWNPLVWWARAQLRDREEEACDQLVVNTEPMIRETYCEVLLSLASGDRSLSPVAGWRRSMLASGMGAFGVLSRRLTMIMNEKPTTSLGWRGTLLLAGCVAMCPMLPTWARQEKSAKVPEVTTRKSDLESPKQEPVKAIAKPSSQVKREDPLARNPVPRTPVVAQNQPAKKAVNGQPEFFPELSPQEAEIEESLNRIIAVEFENTSLADVVAYLNNETGITMILDQQAIADIGKNAQELLVTFKAKQIRLQSMLPLILRQHELTAAINNEVLLVTSIDRARTLATVRSYPVADLVAQSADPDKEIQALAQGLMKTVDPNEWNENGGSEQTSLVPLPASRVLVVSAPDATHRKLLKVLRSIRSANRLTSEFLQQQERDVTRVPQSRNDLLINQPKGPMDLVPIVKDNPNPSSRKDGGEGPSDPLISRPLDPPAGSTVKVDPSKPETKKADSNDSLRQF